MEVSHISTATRSTKAETLAGAKYSKATYEMRNTCRNLNHKIKNKHFIGNKVIIDIFHVNI